MQLKTRQVYAHNTHIFCTRRKHKGFKGTVVNRALLSLCIEGQLEVTLTVPSKCILTMKEACSSMCFKSLILFFFQKLVFNPALSSFNLFFSRRHFFPLILIKIHFELKERLKYVIIFFTQKKSLCW